MVDPVTNATINKAADQARAAADQVAEKATGAVASVKDSVRDSVDSLARRADAATQWTSQKVDAVRQAPSDLRAAGAEYIRARPYAAVAFALALGYVIGRLRR